ncbi:MAG: hypothetical protein Q9221_007760 [Calogaya cf. arnoldii]
MDPITIICSLAGALKIVKEVWETAQWMQKVYGTYTGGDKCLQSMALECHIYGESIKAIGQWLKRNQAATGLRRQMRTTHNAITLVRVSMANVLLDMKNYVDVASRTGHSPTHSKEVPQSLEAKTGNLEKRLLLRQFVTKAIAIKRAELAELSRRGDIEGVSGTLATTIPKSTERLTLYDVVQLARQQALAQKTQRSNQDLIDLSDTPASLENPDSLPSMQNDLTLLELENTPIPRQSLLEPSAESIAVSPAPKPILRTNDTQSTKAELGTDQVFCQQNMNIVELVELDESCADRSNERKLTNSVAPIELPTQADDHVSQPSEVQMTQDTDQPGLDVDGTEGFSAHGLNKKDSIPQLPPYLATHDPLTLPQVSGGALIGQHQPTEEAYDKQTPASSAAPSIFSHSSSFTAVTGGSLPGISEEEMQARNLTSQLKSRAPPLDVKAPSLLSISCQPQIMPQLSSLNEPDEQGSPWIVQAARDGQEEVIRRLLISGADIQATHTTTQRSALAEAAFHGYQRIVDLLIEEGCSIECADVKGNTTLHHACVRGHLVIAKSLIFSGASIDTPGPGGQSALHLAIGAPYQNIAMLLIQRMATINA